MSIAPSRLDALRAEIRAIERAGFAAGERPCVAFGIDDVDSRLAGGGLSAALHEAAAEAPTPNDDAAATLFLAAAAARFALAAGEGAQVLWALTRRDLFAPALAQIGLTPDRLLYAECRNDDELLAVMFQVTAGTGGVAFGSPVVQNLRTQGIRPSYRSGVMIMMTEAPSAVLMKA